MAGDLWSFISWMSWPSWMDAGGSDILGVAARSVAVYLAALLLVRLGEKRFLGKNTAFDFVMGIILGSVLSRAVNSSAPFVSTVAAGAVLIGMHWLLAVLSFKFDRLSVLTKGRSRVIVKDGRIDWDAMRKGNIGERDLLSAIRSEAGLSNIKDVKEARQERGGNISVIKAEEPRVIEVSVADGVQTVRIVIE